MSPKWLAFLLVSVTILHLCLAQKQGDDGLFGCYRDKGAPDRDLGHLAYESDVYNSADKCKSVCRKLGFKFASVQDARQCFCGNSFGKHGKADNCNMKCKGNSEEICGGAWANKVYFTGSLGPLDHYGCFKDGGERDLGRLAYTSAGANSIEKCKDACHKLGFTYAGVQYSTQCFCGYSFGEYGTADNCNMKCSGNSDQICGGHLANSVYKAGIGHFGCFKDKDAPGRDLGRMAYDNAANTVEKCQDACHKLGFKYAGVQASSQCFCGNSFGKYGKSDVCDAKCSGNKAQNCGAGWVNDIYIAGDAGGSAADGSDEESVVSEFEERR